MFHPRALFTHAERWLRFGAVLVALGTFEVTTPTARANAVDPIADAGGALDALPFDQLQQTTIHNAFAVDAPLDALLAQTGVHSVEIDLHRGKHFHRPLDGDWFVYHIDVPLFDGSSCAHFTQCLDALARHHAQTPHHAPLTVFLDVKDPLVGAHDGVTLDRAIASRFPRDALFAPSDLMARCPSAVSLHDAVRGDCTWPTVGALRGKLLFVLTGGDLCRAQSSVSTYMNDGRGVRRRLAFVAGGVTDACRPGAGEFGDETVFFNMDFDHRDAVRAVRDAKGVARVYFGGLMGGLDDAGAWNVVRELGAQFLATDRLRWL